MAQVLTQGDGAWLYSAGGLFLTAFLAASLLPLGSEWLLLLLLSQGGDPLLLWLSASAGNVLGSVLNYALGAGAVLWWRRRFFSDTSALLPDQSKRVPDTSAPDLPDVRSGRGWAQAQRWYQRYGVWSLLLAWLPLVGDPLTLIAGMMRAPLGVFLLLVTLGKAGRYALLILLV
ncbi:YqaA family protein [Thalassolituus sp. LLYu03]|uniref:YqaA family protein n=1 Tax=Thalassolituus sp. LLYu03 TaxID=3421656 RepID=UPI003D2C5551